MIITHIIIILLFDRVYHAVKVLAQRTSLKQMKLHYVNTVNLLSPWVYGVTYFGGTACARSVNDKRQTKKIFYNHFE